MAMKRQAPIVITAFGTTTEALQTCDRLDGRVRVRFSGHGLRRACSSREVTDRDFPAGRFPGGDWRGSREL